MPRIAASRCRFIDLSSDIRPLSGPGEPPRRDHHEPGMVGEAPLPVDLTGKITMSPMRFRNRGRPPWTSRAIAVRFPPQVRRRSRRLAPSTLRPIASRRSEKPATTGRRRARMLRRARPAPSIPGRGEERMPPALDRPSPNAAWDRLAGVALPVTIVGAVLVFIGPGPAGRAGPAPVGQHHAGGPGPVDDLAVRSPGEFAAFPTILLTTTLTRLVLNVATTRLVLTQGRRQGARSGRRRGPGVRRVRRRGPGGRRARSCSRSCW